MGESHRVFNPVYAPWRIRKGPFLTDYVFLFFVMMLMLYGPVMAMNQLNTLLYNPEIPLECRPIPGDSKGATDPDVNGGTEYTFIVRSRDRQTDAICTETKDTRLIIYHNLDTIIKLVFLLPTFLVPIACYASKHEDRYKFDRISLSDMCKRADRYYAQSQV